VQLLHNSSNAEEQAAGACIVKASPLEARRRSQCSTNTTVFQALHAQRASQLYIGKTLFNHNHELQILLTHPTPKPHLEQQAQASWCGSAFKAALLDKRQQEGRACKVCNQMHYAILSWDTENFQHLKRRQLGIRGCQSMDTAHTKQ